MKSAVFSAPHNMQVKEVEIPSYKDDEILVRVKACGICGTDVECYLGNSIEGVFPYVPGHEWSGEVSEVGDAVTSLKKGDKVVGQTVEPCGICDRCKNGMNPELCRNPRVFGFTPATPGGFSEYSVRKERFLSKLPGNCSFIEGALVEPFSVAYYGVWVNGGGVQASEDVVITGLGPIGLFALAAVKVVGARTICVDPIERRRELALNLGADVVIDPSKKDATDEILSLTGGFGADLVVDASGSPSALGKIVDMADNGGRISLIGNSFNKTIPVEIWKVVMKGLSIRGSAGSRFQSAIELIAGRKVDLLSLVSHKFSLPDVGDAFELASKRVESIKILVLP